MTARAPSLELAINSVRSTNYDLCTNGLNGDHFMDDDDYRAPSPKLVNMGRHDDVHLMDTMMVCDFCSDSRFGE